MSNCCETRIISINGSGDVDFSALTPQDIANLQAALNPIFIVNSGTTAASTDNANGEQNVEFGDVLHFWSSDGSIQFNVTAGSTIVDAAINPAVLSGIAHTEITAIDLRPTANPNEYTVEISWTDSDGVAQTTTDATPITLSDMNYANNDLTADANRTHDWSTFDQTEQFTSGEFTQEWTNGTSTASLLLNDGRFEFDTEDTSYNGSAGIFATDTGVVRLIAARDQVNDQNGGVLVDVQSPTSQVKSFFNADDGTQTEFALGSNGGTAATYIKDATVVASTASAGEVLTLINATTGRVEFAPAAAGALPITLSDTTADANHTQDFDSFGQTWNNMGSYDVNITQGNFDVNVSAAFIPGEQGDLNVGLGTVVASTVTTAPNSLDSEMRLSPFVAEIRSENIGSEAAFSIKNGGVGSALGLPQLHIETQAIFSGSATVGQVLTLGATNGEAEWRDVVATPTNAVFLPSNQIPQTDPTAANVTAWIAGNFLPGDEPAGQLIYYTGTAVAGDETTHAYWADGTGTVRQIEKPSDGSNMANTNLALTGDRVHTMGTNDFRINGDNGAEFAINIFDNAGFPPTGTSIFSDVDSASLIFAGPGGGVVSVDDSGVNLSFSGTGDLEIDGQAGGDGQVLRSNGAGSPPSWSYGMPVPVNTLADVPAVSALVSGQMFLVVNDSANNGVYYANGSNVGAAATTIDKVI